MIQVNCPYCANLLVDDGGLAGQLVMCPRCGGQMQMPGAAPPPMHQTLATQNSSPQFLPSSTSTTSTYRRRQNSSSNLLIAIIALVAVAAVGCVIFIVSNTGETKVAIAQPKRRQPSQEKPVEPLEITGTAEIQVQAATPSNEPEQPTGRAPDKADPVKAPDRAMLDAAKVWMAPADTHPARVPDQFRYKFVENVTNEFDFRNESTKIHRSHFDQKNHTELNLLQSSGSYYEGGRNELLGPGRYDFDTGLFYLSAVLWARADTKRIANMPDNIEHDFCRLDFVIKMDEAQAETLKRKIQSRSASIDLWYYPKQITQAASSISTRFDVRGVTIYQLAIDVEAVHFEVH